MRRLVLVLGGLLVFSLASAPVASAGTTAPAGQSVVEATVDGDDLTLNGTSRGSVILRVGTRP